MEDYGDPTCENPEGPASSVSSVFLVTLRMLLNDLRSIELPSPKECALAFQAAFESSWHALSAWASVLALFLSPLLQFLAVLARAVWPHARGAAVGLWKYQASLPLSTVLAEAAAIVLVVAAFLLRRFIVRQRYLPRAQRRVRLFRARLNRSYVSFTRAVERNFRLSARAFPHLVYWTAAGSFALLAPTPAAWLRENFSVFMAATWPFFYALYLTLQLRSQNGLAAATAAAGVAGIPTPGGGNGRRMSTPASAKTPVARTPGTGAGPAAGEGTPARSPGAALARGSAVLPQDVDRVLMYWVVFMVVKVLSMLPLASTLVEVVATSYVRSLGFFLVVWMHLPGPGSGLQVVYALLEPLVHKYVRDLRMPENGSGTMDRIQSLLVFVRLMTKEHAELLVDNIADSWLLVPTLLCFFTPSFITNIGCVYAGLVIPSFNSIKALGRGGANAAGRGSGISDGWAALATSAGSARVRWLTYWVAYGGWWQISWHMGWILRVLPLASHAQLALLLWLQVPLFRGGGRILDFGERCLDRWASGPVTATAADADADAPASRTITSPPPTSPELQ